MQGVSVLAGVLMVIGTLGVLIPVLPGTLLCVAGVLLWSVATDESFGWWVFAAAVAVALLGWTLKYLLPGRRMACAGVPRHAVFAGTVCALVGFFVIPYIGLAIGFPAGVYAAEHVRLRDARSARAATWVAVKAVALSVGIELATATTITALWICGLLLTR